MSIEAMKQALEALEYKEQGIVSGEKDLTNRAITSLRQAIAEAEKQERGEPSYADRLLAHIEDFAKHCGWSKESGEGAFECVQRTSYAQGVEDGKLQRKQEQGEPVENRLNPNILYTDHKE